MDISQKLFYFLLLVISFACAAPRNTHILLQQYVMAANDHNLKKPWEADGEWHRVDNWKRYVKWNRRCFDTIGL